MVLEPALRSWWVYILECADGTLYTGCTTDVARRVHEHNHGARGAKYTRSRRPVKLLGYRRYLGRSDAQRVEASIKPLTPWEKRKVARSWGTPEDT
jgi:putative endonuclease